MKYCIIHVNDRSKDLMEHNKEILSSFDYIDDFVFFNGNTGNAWDVINHKGIKQDVWNPYDGRSFPPLPGELGIWVSTINVWEYIVENKIDKMLVLEDDIALQDNFVDSFNLFTKDLPKDFDFLSLYYFNDQNKISPELEVIPNKIQKSHNQYSAGQAILYSYAGAKKLLNCVSRKGIEYTTDCFIFRQSLEGLVNGYSIIGTNSTFLKHEYNDIKSLIDPENKRSTNNL
jgi:GR25 family glycosyltransferase involved in LPS biosynthesis